MKPGDGPGAVVAFRRLFLGDTDRNGAKSASAWKEFGFDIDGKVSTEASTDLCKPRAGGNKSSVYPDGNNGIDNSFGKNLLPIFTGIAADFSTQVNESIASGRFTIVFDVTTMGASSDYNPLLSRLYMGGDYGIPPKFDGTDAWPLRSESFSSPPDLSSAKVQFPASYVTSNVWVSGIGDGVLIIQLDFSGSQFPFRIHRPLLAMTLASDHASATLGTISGVLDTEEFIEDLKQMAGAISADLCSGTTIESIANQMRQASDIMKDGTPGSPTVECDAVSIGLGFDAGAVQLGTVSAPLPPPPDPCAD